MINYNTANSYDSSGSEYDSSDIDYSYSPNTPSSEDSFAQEQIVRGPLLDVCDEHEFIDNTHKKYFEKYQHLLKEFELECEKLSKLINEDNLNKGSEQNVYFYNLINFDISQDHHIDGDISNIKAKKEVVNILTLLLSTDNFLKYYRLFKNIYNKCHDKKYFRQILKARTRVDINATDNVAVNYVEDNDTDNITEKFIDFNKLINNHSVETIDFICLFIDYEPRLLQCLLNDLNVSYLNILSFITKECCNDGVSQHSDYTNNEALKCKMSGKRRNNIVIQGINTLIPVFIKSPESYVDLLMLKDYIVTHQDYISKFINRMFGSFLNYKHNYEYSNIINNISIYELNIYKLIICIVENSFNTVIWQNFIPNMLLIQPEYILSDFYNKKSNNGWIYNNLTEIEFKDIQLYFDSFKEKIYFTERRHFQSFKQKAINIFMFVIKLKDKINTLNFLNIILSNFVLNNINLICCLHDRELLDIVFEFLNRDKNVFLTYDEKGFTPYTDCLRYGSYSCVKWIHSLIENDSELIDKGLSNILNEQDSFDFVFRNYDWRVLKEFLDFIILKTNENMIEKKRYNFRIADRIDDNKNLSKKIKILIDFVDKYDPDLFNNNYFIKDTLRNTESMIFDKTYKPVIIDSFYKLSKPRII